MDYRKAPSSATTVSGAETHQMNAEGVWPGRNAPCHASGSAETENGASVFATGKLTKKYGGRTVVEKLELRIPEGCAYGYPAAIGSGTSMSMETRLSLIYPSIGEAHAMDRPSNISRRNGPVEAGALTHSR